MKKCLMVLALVMVVGCDEPTTLMQTKVAEASGIDFCHNTGTLIVANDEGVAVEISKKGKVLRKIPLGKYDLEGVVCDENSFMFALENKGVLWVDRITGVKKEILINANYKGETLTLFGKKAGVEGIAKEGNRLYLAKQAKKKQDSFVAVVDLSSQPLRVVDVIVYEMADIAGLTFHNGSLYMVSDKEDKLVQYDVSKKQSIKEVKLPKGAWEGIAFDDEGFVYLANDDGSVVKYTQKSLGL